MTSRPRPGAPQSMSAARYDHGHWRQYAACRAIDTDLFFPAGTLGPYQEQNDLAKSICSGCPVRIACLRFALATNQQFGIWGGLDEEERSQLRRRWRSGAALAEAGGEAVQTAAS